jgi:hypothetical protein
MVAEREPTQSPETLLLPQMKNAAETGVKHQGTLGLGPTGHNTSSLPLSFFTPVIQRT